MGWVLTTANFVFLLDTALLGINTFIITSQLPPTQYHDYIGEPTLADSICDRLLHNTHRIVLKGPSRRKEDKLDT